MVSSTVPSRALQGQGCHCGQYSNLENCLRASYKVTGGIRGTHRIRWIRVLFPHLPRQAPCCRGPTNSHSAVAGSERAHLENRMWHPFPTILLKNQGNLFLEKMDSFHDLKAYLPCTQPSLLDIYFLPAMNNTYKCHGVSPLKTFLWLDS